MADATTNDREAVFTYLMNSGMHVKVTIAPTINGIIRNDFVEIHDAPPRALREIVNNFTMVSLRPGGLLIPLTPVAQGS